VTEEGGTGAEGALKGFLVAGKTGTAQKAVGGKGYDENKWIASFIGFVPAENPRLAISVVIDEPLISHYGGTVAAPALRRVADEALKYLGVSPRSIERSEAIQRVARHRKKETSDDPADEAAGQEEVLTRETPGPNQVLIPDLTGMSMKQVVNHLSVLGLRPLFQGTGFAAEQIPLPLSAIDKGAFVQVNFLPETKEPTGPGDEAPADESAAEDAKEGADGASSERALEVRPDEDRG
jgi:cell division protein FtsI (penicillin-binding protein 3)